MQIFMGYRQQSTIRIELQRITVSEITVYGQ